MAHLSTPPNILNMFTIFVYSDGFYIPICHFLLQNKLFSTYKNAINLLKDECQKLSFDLQSNVSTIMLDFEISMIKALSVTLCQSKIQGCRFHLGQSWWRKINQLGLSQTFKNPRSVAGRWLRRCFGLPRLPAAMVTRVFAKFSEMAKINDPKVKEFQGYLRKNYTMANSLFPPSQWAGLEEHTTNNSAEAFHRHFGDMFGHSYKPNIWKFLRIVKKYNEHKSVKISSYRSVQQREDFWSEPIREFLDKKLSIVKMLDILSKKSQPKTISLRGRK